MDIKRMFKKRTLEQSAWIGKKAWNLNTLLEATKDLKEFDLSLDSLDLGVNPWDLKDVWSFLREMQAVKQVDFKYPVILAPEGWVMDGWHRVAKAIMQGKKTIKAVRLIELPEPDKKESD